MLGGDGVRLEIGLEAFAPDCVEALRLEAWHEFGPRRVLDAMRWIEIVGFAEKAAMIRWMPILARVDAGPIGLQKPIYFRHDLQAARHRQLFRT